MKEQFVLRTLAQVARPIQETALSRELKRRRHKISKGGLYKILHGKRVKPLLKIKKLSRKNTQIDFDLKNEDTRRFLLDCQIQEPPRELIQEAERDVKVILDLLPKAAKLGLQTYEIVVQLAAQVVLLKYAERVMEDVRIEAESITSETALQVEEYYSRRSKTLRLIYRDGIKKLMNAKIDGSQIDWKNAVTLVRNGWSDASELIREGNREGYEKNCIKLDKLVPPEVPKSSNVIRCPSTGVPISLTAAERAALNDAMRRDRFIPRIKKRMSAQRLQLFADAVKKSNIEKIEDQLRNTPSLLNTPLEDGKTAIHLASESGDIATFNFLLEHGARIDVKDQNGKTPVDIAKRFGHRRIENELEKRLPLESRWKMKPKEVAEGKTP
jgi:hypothetical protein